MVRVVVVLLVLVSVAFDASVVVGGKERHSKSPNEKNQHVWPFIDTTPLQTPGNSGRETPFVRPV